MISNLRVLLLLLITAFVYMPQSARAQDPNQKEGGDLPPGFLANPVEASVTCGQFLPNQIQGITEMMPMCGGRFGFKISKTSVFEGQGLGGAAVSQRYLIASANFRSDFGMEDFIVSAYFGGDIHYATAPIYNANNVAAGESTNMYYGGHVGGAVWFEASDNVYFRTDLQFFLNPGTALYVGFGVVLKFGAGGGSGGAGGGQ